ncbi:hypothetical protein HYH03_011181 [Edaphochlamys debaryana]|uniref:AB hydrolase-1 domain-containing protein n=1 Tax=Edaphochlamys debaryana TaxID=47281 RepID=A0A835XV60_9CHLO|nr:hypothetical protein HYH03_011181 [Edaphochlamys debaryana]|eukprot:KAG2490380.1 hypothetical protein HYH03_011181 [Edaphochlamys debaryana]
MVGGSRSGNGGGGGGSGGGSGSGGHACSRSRRRRPHNAAASAGASASATPSSAATSVPTGTPRVAPLRAPPGPRAALLLLLVAPLCLGWHALAAQGLPSGGAAADGLLTAPSAAAAAQADAMLAAAVSPADLAAAADATAAAAGSAVSVAQGRYQTARRLFLAVVPEGPGPGSGNGTGTGPAAQPQAPPNTSSTPAPTAPPSYPGSAPAPAPAPASPAAPAAPPPAPVPPSNPAISNPDLLGPVLSGDAAGLAAYLPPNATVPVSAYALRIDDMAGLVTPKGYPLEKHVVVTSDGYKLATFRIPYGRSGPNADGKKRPPVLLVHGISLASTCWVVNQPYQSLAFILADRGYDVWMMNTRGNTFSRQHVRLTDSQMLFWNFGVDEMAHIDLKENLDYILGATQAKKLAVVGHSQGATLGLMALADEPGLADRVSVLVALGPCAYVKYMTSVILSNFCAQTNTSVAFRLLPPQELIYMNSYFQETYLNGICQTAASLLTCLTSVEAMFGASSRITATQYRRYWQIWPSSTSLGNAIQWAQIYNEPKPRFFKRNYGAEYDLGKIRAPVVMVSGTSDVLASPQDVKEQLKRLRTTKSQHVIPGYSHMDFIWDQGAFRTSYPIITGALDDAAYLAF